MPPIYTVKNETYTLAAYFPQENKKTHGIVLKKYFNERLNFTKAFTENNQKNEIKNTYVNC